MTMNRKGISFTLTLVVIGVVLLMTALTVIVLGGSQIGGFFNRGGESSLQASVSQACGNLAQAIDRNYCDYYTNSGDCTDVRANPSNTYTTTAAQESCNWQNQGGGRVNSLLKNADGSAGGNLPMVKVQGNWYNCLNEAQMTPVCPASGN